MSHVLNPTPFTSSRVNTVGACHVRCSCHWRKERQSDQPCSLIKITPNTLGEEDKHPTSKFHSACVALRVLEKPERCCPLLTAQRKAEVTSNWPEIFFKHLHLTNPSWNYKQESVGYKGGGISPGKTDSPPGRFSADRITGFRRESLEHQHRLQQLFTLPRARGEQGAKRIYLAPCWCARLAPDTQTRQFDAVTGLPALRCCVVGQVSPVIPSSNAAWGKFGR